MPALEQLAARYGAGLTLPVLLDVDGQAADALTAGLLYGANAPTRTQFAPQSGAWRTFEVTTRVDIAKPSVATRVWMPIPSVNSDYQRSLESSYTSNGTAKLMQDGKDGAKMPTRCVISPAPPT